MKTWPKGIDALVVIGGDGTLLRLIIQSEFNFPVMEFLEQ
jgi:6-phosphofructokinase